MFDLAAVDGLTGEAEIREALEAFVAEVGDPEQWGAFAKLCLRLCLGGGTGGKRLAVDMETSLHAAIGTLTCEFHQELEVVEREKAQKAVDEVVGKLGRGAVLDALARMPEDNAGEYRIVARTPPFR